MIKLVITAAGCSLRVAVPAGDPDLCTSEAVPIDPDYLKYLDRPTLEVKHSGRPEILASKRLRAQDFARHTALVQSMWEQKVLRGDFQPFLNMSIFVGCSHCSVDDAAIYAMIINEMCFCDLQISDALMLLLQEVCTTTSGGTTLLPCCILLSSSRVLTGKRKRDQWSSSLMTNLRASCPLRG